MRASADGTVVFAGPVAGTLHVTLRHADGVRTSYSVLAAIEVVLEGLHLSKKRNKDVQAGRYRYRS